MIELMGFIGGLFLAFCALPQAIKSFKDGHSEGISHGMIWLWFLGEVIMLGYILLKYGLSDPWLLLNYGMNVIVISVIMKYKYWRRDNG